MPEHYLSASDSRLGFEAPVTAQQSGTDDFVAQAFIARDDLILEGVFFQKPETTVLTLSLSVGHGGAEIDLIKSEAADAETSAFRASKIPIPKGSRMVLDSTGGVNGAKVVTFVFRTARSGV